MALQYGNAFGQGLQAAALKPADFFGNDDVLYLMEDMATGEIRLSILWEWLHKHATLTAADEETGAKANDRFTPELFARLVAEEHEKLQRAGNRDVHDVSKRTTLPIAREIVRTSAAAEVALAHDRQPSTSITMIRQRPGRFTVGLRLQKDGMRVTENLI